MKKPKLSTNKIKLILSGKYKKHNKKAFLIALATANFAVQSAIINSQYGVSKIVKAQKAIQLMQLALTFTESIKQISKLK